MQENGCLRYELESADAGTVRPHGFSGVVGFSQQLVEYGERERAREVAVPAAPGDLLVHHSRMVHRADANASATRHRRAIGAIFYSSSAQVDEAAHAARQEEICQRAAALQGQQL